MSVLYIEIVRHGRDLPVPVHMRVAGLSFWLSFSPKRESRQWKYVIDASTAAKLLVPCSQPEDSSMF